MRTLLSLPGGKALTDEVGIPLEKVRLEDLGRAKKVFVSSDTTALVDGAGSPQSIEARAKIIRSYLREGVAGYEQEALQLRLANLLGRIAVIRVGGNTSEEAADNRYRVESALHSAITASEEGYVIGGGLTLFHAARQLHKPQGMDEGSVEGFRAVMAALEQPFRTLVQNAKQSDTQIVAEVAKSPDSRVGFHAATGKLEDLKEAGVLDSAKAIRIAVTVAFSCVRTILETGAWDLSEPENPKKD